MKLATLIQFAEAYVELPLGMRLALVDLVAGGDVQALPHPRLARDLADGFLRQVVSRGDADLAEEAAHLTIDINAALAERAQQARKE